jgi:hypothetical protein
VARRHGEDLAEAAVDQAAEGMHQRRAEHDRMEPGWTDRAMRQLKRINEASVDELLRWTKDEDVAVDGGFWIDFTKARGIASCKTGNGDGEDKQLSICPRLLARGWIAVGARRNGWGRNWAKRTNAIDWMSDNNNQTRDWPELIQEEVDGGGSTREKKRKY